MEKPFDFVIVGAGSAGCVLANRLTRDPTVRVLLLEAGPWDTDPLIGIPMGAKALLQAQRYHWGDWAEPEPRMGATRMMVPHGRVIGGTSSINFFAHTRGHPADFDRWVTMGAKGWSYPEVLPFYKECETWEKGGDEWRGGEGELGAQEVRMVDPLFPAAFDALRALGYPITKDWNGEQPEGYGPVQYSVRDGRRSSSAQAFLRPALQRPNLTVRTDSLATRLLFQGRRVVGVEYVLKGQTVEVQAGRIALCLGAINTPHLLMLSGVGPAAHLESMGIRPVIDLPVGKGLEDHLGYELSWSRKTPGPFHRLLRFDRLAISMLRAHWFHSGPATRLPGAIIGFVKSQPALVQPDLELLLIMAPPWADTWFPLVKKPYVDGFTIRVQLSNQLSRGEILLRSSNPQDRPRIFYNSLSAPRDLETLRAGFQHAWALGSSRQLSDFRLALLKPDRIPQGDAQIDDFIRSTAVQQYHPASTCRMGNDELAVLDEHLNIRGLEGIGVVDASAMPSLVSANPNVTIMMMAAKAARLWASGG